MSKGHTGIPLSPEHIAAISAATLGIPKPPRTLEHCAALSVAKLGIPISPHTPEHCAAMSKAREGVPKSPEQIAAIVRGQEEAGTYEAMIGGDDIVWHHTLYDHADLSKNRVPMTRRNHTMEHNVLQILGIEIPHINVQEK